MVRRGVAATRTEASIAILGGRVTVGGRPAIKAATLVTPDEPIVLSGPSRPFVSRGGEKLAAALDRFGIDVSGRSALDAGASTGGFTDCLLSRGAARVVAVDVGYGQLDWRLRGDARVTVMERTNVRELQPGDLPHAVDLVVADLSFISLVLVLPALAGAAGAPADLVALVKPQFEAGRADVRRGGVVTDPAAWRRVLSSVATACEREGLAPVGVALSALLGPAGNVEFFLHAVRPPRPADPPIGRQIDAAVDEAGTALRAARGSGRPQGRP